MTYATLFSTIVESKSAQIADIEVSIGSYEQQIEELRQRIDEQRQLQTQIEVERAAVENAQQASDSALQQVEQAVSMIKGLEDAGDALKLFLEQVKGIIEREDPAGFIEAATESDTPDDEPDPSGEALEVPVEPVVDEEQEPTDIDKVVAIPTGTMIIHKEVETPTVLPTMMQISHMKKVSLQKWLTDLGEDSTGKIGELRLRLIAKVTSMRKQLPAA
ncbi:MAG: hypothetical protein KME30_17245 [Iphinoe sp. HA4291-MV1]|jgi:hypothetical protein|nr:hypothetical protein [Iphinoe sp. HA4291-MV1]